MHGGIAFGLRAASVWRLAQDLALEVDLAYAQRRQGAELTRQVAQHIVAGATLRADVF